MPRPLSGTDRIDVQEWVADLTYGEIHAFLWGAGLAAVATLSQSAVVGSLAVGLLLYAVGGRAAVARDDKVPTENIPEQLRRQIKRQPHYYIFGGFVGIVLGFIALTLGVDPSALDPFVPF